MFVELVMTVWFISGAVTGNIVLPDDAEIASI
jgi:hypothetical protein